MANKILTNQQAFRNLVDNTDQMTLAIVRALVVQMAKDIQKDKAKVLADHANGIFTGESLIAASEAILKHVGFEER